MRGLRLFATRAKDCIGILIGLALICELLMTLTDKFATSSNFFNITRQKPLLYR